MVEIDRVCGNSSCNKTGKHLCSGCGEEIYCSKDCQKEHWSAHKLACKTAVKPEAAAFLKSFDALSVKQLKNILKAKAASFDKKKKDRILASLDNISEKPSLVKLVEEHVKADEIETLLSSSTPTTDSTSSSSTTKKSTQQQKAKIVPHNNTMPTPTPAQLRQQADMMRKNPGMVRNAQPAFKNMTDAQIRSYADQLEQAASDPMMMKEVERMSKLSEPERNDLQAIQEGLSGSKPMDSAWMDRTIGILKSNSALFKSMLSGKGAMLGGVTDEQVESFIDMAAKIDAYTLKLILRALVFLGSLYRPALDLYAKVDSWTFGMARYIALAIFMFFAYWTSVAVFHVLKFVFLQLYAVVMFLVKIYNGKAAATAAGAAGAAAKTTVINSAPLAATGAKKVAETVAAAGATAAAGKIAASLLENAAGAVNAGGVAQKVVEVDDAEYDF